MCKCTNKVVECCELLSWILFLTSSCTFAKSEFFQVMPCPSDKIHLGCWRKVCCPDPYLPHLIYQLKCLFSTLWVTELGQVGGGNELWVEFPPVNPRFPQPWASVANPSLSSNKFHCEQEYKWCALVSCHYAVHVPERCHSYMQEIPPSNCFNLKIPLL